MPSTIEEGAALTLGQFWKWIKEHPNCILRASTPESYLYDHDHLHWHLTEEDDSVRVVQLIHGKQLVAEIVIDPRDLLYVQVSPDTEQPEHFLFEIVAGPKHDANTVCAFLMAHDMQSETSHSEVLKH